MDAQITAREGWQWSHFTVESGLPSNSIVDVVEGDGVVWAATGRGLAWYDGYFWRVLPLPEGGRGEVRSISPLGNNRVVVVMDGRLFTADTTGMTVLPLGGEGDVDVVNSAVAVDGNTILGTASLDDGLVIFEFRDGEARTRSPPVSARRFSNAVVKRSRDGRVWLATSAELFLLDGVEWRTVLEAEVSDVSVGDDGTTFLGLHTRTGGDGVWTLDSALEASPLSVSHRQRVHSVSAGANGVVAVVFEGGLVCTLGVEADCAHSVGGDSEGAQLVRRRDNGDLWIGTDDAGLFLHRRAETRWRRWSYPRGDPRNLVSDILVRSDGSVWIASGTGIEIRSRDGIVQRTFREVAGQDFGGVTGLLEDSDGGVWASSGLGMKGVLRWDGSEWRHFAEADGLDAIAVHRMYLDRSGRVWFAALGGPDGAGRGAYLYENGVFERWDPEGFPDGRVYAFLEGPDGAFWVATSDRLSRWQDSKWRHWGWDDGLQPSSVFTLTMDSANVLWFGHRNHGFGWVDGDSLRYVSPAESFPHDGIMEMRFASDGRLWLATMHGLCTGSLGAWTCLRAPDGLGRVPVWPIRFDGDRVLVGTTGEGLNILDLAASLASPPRVLATLQGDVARQVTIRIRAAAEWGRMRPDRIETRYRLDGASWSLWGPGRTATFDDVSYGRHIVDVQAKGMLGDLSSQPAQVAFTVRAPLYLRPVVVVPIGSLVLVLFAAIVFAVRRERDRMDQLRLISDSLPALVGYVDRDRCIRFANRAYRDIRGWNPEEMIGKNIEDVFSEATMSQVAPHVTAALDGASRSFTGTRTGPEAPPEYWRANYVPDRGPDGAVRGFFYFIWDVTDEKEAEESLQRTVAQKDVLLREVHHRVKNNLQIVSSLLYLQVDRTEIHDPKRILEESRDRVAAMSLVHESLYDAHDLTNIDAQEYFDQLGSRLLYVYQGQGNSITLDTQVDVPLLPLDVAIPCGLIVNELLTNAIKYAFPGGRGGAVDLRLTADQGLFTLSVSDDGVGLAEGTFEEGSGTLGFRLVRSLVSQLGGELAIDRRNGTRFTIRFEVPPEEFPATEA